MKAYAIFDGGGVKGAALAGCLAAAEGQGIEFVGYGGTSAGSIVAALASVGYTGDELGRILVEQPFTDFLDDGGQALERLTRRKEEMASLWRSGGLWSRFKAVWLLREVAVRFWEGLGVYEGDALRQFLEHKIRARVPQLSDDGEISFERLEQAGCVPLKIVASDVTRRKPAVFSRTESRYGESVIEAVRASSSYPFAFKPVERADCQLVDGGLSSNLPAFLFDDEFRETRVPAFAFDLIAPPRGGAKSSHLGHFAEDMLNTALEASDRIIRGVTQGVIHIPIHVSPGVDALDFAVDRQQRQALYDAGYTQTVDFLKDYAPLVHSRLAGNELKKELMARFGNPKLFEPVLAALARDIEEFSAARGIRTNIMLPTGRGTRIVVYHYGMEGDADSDMELGEEAGGSGLAWASSKPVVADLEEVARDPAPWMMTVEQHAKIPRRVKAMMAVPIAGGQGARIADGLPPIGVLSVDSETPLADTRWIENAQVRAEIVEIATGWAHVVSRLLL